jgi:branched-chain amino acid transport system permease protein
MSLDILAQIAIGGVLIGGLYALFAFGLSLIYGVARILNFSHGTLLGTAGIAASVLYAALEWHPLVLLVLLVPVFFAFGCLFYLVLLGPLRNRNHFQMTVGTVLTTVGALIILSDVAAWLAGPRPRNIPIRSEVFEIGDVLIPASQAYMLVGITLLTVALHLFLQRSWFGRSVRAVTQDHVGAAICGVRSNRIHALTFGMGSALAAVAGVLYAMTFPIDPYAGFHLTVKAFTIIVLGGIGNLIGALIAGLFLGLAEAFTAFFWASEWASALSIVLLLIILVLFPRGLGSWKRA